MTTELSFQLNEEFVNSYRDRPVDWGYIDAHGTSVSEITYLRTYSRFKDDGSKEQWYETVARVINGTFSIQKNWAKQNRLPWSDVKAQRTAERMYKDLWSFRWSPPGRGLFAMGSPRVHGDRGSSTALNNCSTVSTNLMTKNDPAKPFVKLMDNSMLGVGVGFDTDGYKKGFRVHRPEESDEVFVVPDTREGWSESVGILINAYLKPNQSLPRFDYSEIRAAGEPIRTFGGIAPGPDPLVQLHERLTRVFEEKVGQEADSMLILDIANIIGVGVVSGGVRRSALLAAGDPDDREFIDAKDLEKNPNRSEWFFMSNNSIKVNTTNDLSHILDGIKLNGEPGVLWMDVAHNYGRIEDGVRTDDQKTVATNPCFGPETVFVTRDGDRKLGDTVGESVEVWADDWYPATVESFGFQQLNRVTFNNDTVIRVTPNHRWELIDGSLTHDIKVGDRVPATSPYDEELPDYWEVTSIEPDGVEEVFCAIVPGKERFTLAGGIYTSNCGEIFLEGGGELCCLADVYIGRQGSKEEFFRSLKNAYLYAKTVTLLPTEDPDTNAIIQRNRRIGVSLSGVADFADNEGIPKLREWMDEGYRYLRKLDEKYSKWLCVRESIRLTTSKPGGTTGIVFGQSPGVHWSPGGRTFHRGIIFQKSDPIVGQLRAAGYRVEKSVYTPETSVFVQFPVKSQAKRSESEVSLFEKANLAATAQRYWADNSVSVTLSFDRDTEGDQLPLVLDVFLGQLKSASFLPMGKDTYPQMPYQSMTRGEYDEVEGTCFPVDLAPVYRGNALEAVGENYCTTDKCELPQP